MSNQIFEVRLAYPNTPRFSRVFVEFRNAKKYVQPLMRERKGDDYYIVMYRREVGDKVGDAIYAAKKSKKTASNPAEQYEVDFETLAAMSRQFGK